MNEIVDNDFNVFIQDPDGIYIKWIDDNKMEYEIFDRHGYLLAVRFENADDKQKFDERFLPK